MRRLATRWTLRMRLLSAQSRRLSSGNIGILRMRTVLAAKMAFANAGAVLGVAAE